MTVKEVKEILPIIQAFVDGKIIQYRGLKGDWIDYTNPEYLSINFLSFSHNYRVKPSPKYRPFKTKEECWEAMHNHSDFGWVKNKSTGHYFKIEGICKIDDETVNVLIDDSTYTLYGVFNSFTFIDNTPFGTKEK